MYEEENRSISINWGSLLIRLVALALILFIAGWLFVKLSGNKTNTQTTLASTNSNYITNINMMKTAAFEYFTQSRLPEKVGGTEKITLAQMINQKLLIDFTDDGRTCDINSSYIQATKTVDENYALKVSLTCEEKSDFIVTTIEKKSTNDTVNSDVIIDNTDKEESNSNKQETTNSSTTNKNNTSSSNTNNYTGQTVANTTNKTSTKVTTTVTTTVYVSFSCTNGCCQNTCCQTNCGTTKPQEPTEPTPTPSEPETPTKTRYYKHIKYSEWQDGKLNAENAENKYYSYNTYNYCKLYNETYYSTSYISSSNKSGKYSYEVQYLNLPSDIKDIYVVNNSKSYFSSSLTDYQAYINKRGSLYMTGNNESANVKINNATSFRTSSLKSNNFTFNISGVYYNRSASSWATSITINYNNLDGVTPYYACNICRYVYFVPVKWNIEYTKESGCKRDTEANKNNYKDYVMTDKKAEYKWMHRTFEYKWSTEKTLEGYTYTGEYEDRV